MCWLTKNYDEQSWNNPAILYGRSQTAPLRGASENARTACLCVGLAAAGAKNYTRGRETVNLEGIVLLIRIQN